MFKEIPALPEVGFADFRKLPISLNVGTGYYIINERRAFSWNLTATLLSP
jgi:hypothetical protein